MIKGSFNLESAKDFVSVPTTVLHMKEKWLMALGAWEEIKPRITTALESGFDCVLVDRDNIERVRELGKIKVACFGHRERD